MADKPNPLVVAADEALERPSGNGDADMVLIGPSDTEVFCKVVERARVNLESEVLRARAYAALEGMLPAVVFRRRGSEEWLVVMPAEDFSELVSVARGR